MPDPPVVVWRKRLSGQSMAGLAATEKYLLVADRDALDTQDIFRCLHPETGEELWSVRDFSAGQLDYGNATRATPLIHGDLVYLYNAFGRLHCVELATGRVVWKRDLCADFGGGDPDNAWGTTSSPIVVDDKLIANPGGREASVVALRPSTGEVVWKSRGGKAAFASFIVGTFGRRQLVGYDRLAICGWDIDKGTSRWRHEPTSSGDFNVPTPIAVGDRLLVATENNGTRLYEFDPDGTIVPQPLATNNSLAPDTHTPVVLGNRVFGVCQGLYCLALENGLKPIWKATDKAFDDYATAIAAGDRLLIVSLHGELLLIDAAAANYRLISRVKVFTDDPGVYSHPALLGTRLYLRGSEEVICLELGNG